MRILYGVLGIHPELLTVSLRETGATIVYMLEDVVESPFKTVNWQVGRKK